MRLATWNINGLRARLELLLRWLDDRRPDVVGLQELKMADDALPRDRLRQAGYHVAAHGQKAWNGVAVLSREPSTVERVGLPGQEAMGARLLTTRISGLSFVSVYVPNGKSVDHDDFARKLTWLEALDAYLDGSGLPGGDAVVCGDFNICPAPIDSWNEEGLQGTIFHTDEERARFRALLDRGLVDLFRQRHPTTPAFSWWDYRGGAFHRRQGLRIDLVLATERVGRRLRAVEIDREYRKKRDGLTPSDHAPVIADLD
jgi:exodeoxyribonuclease-3